MGPIRRVLQATAAALARPVGSAGLRRWLLRRPVPPERETQAVPGCRAAVVVRIDQEGVPHIEAANDHDLFLAQGYCHARDRLWQMELNRRLARGELAALFGQVALPADRLLRRLGFRRAAERELASLDDALCALLDAYAAGVNAYARTHRLAVEFVLLRQKPRPWTSVDSLAFARYMGWMMTANGESELIRHRLRSVLGEEMAAALEPATGTYNPAWAADPVASPTAATTHPSPLTPHQGGSNAWAVSANRSTTDRPLLANDPHLRPRLPGAWHIMHLRGGGYDVAGATLPGTLGVLIGHNAHVAWGITAGQIDCQDVYEERPGDDDREVIREEITVRGRATPVIEEVVRTRHGPLLNGCMDVPVDGAPLALQSMPDRLPTPLPATLRLNRAASVAEFRATLAEWTFPALNYVFADTTGRIGYQLAGRVPLRAAGDGAVPAPGWTGTHEWVGEVPFADMPGVLDPPEGWVATANSKPEVPCTAFLARDFTDGHRQRRVVELLGTRAQHSPADFEAIQNDVVSLAARDVARRLSAAFPNNATVALLRDWDGRLDVDSVAASVYQVFRHELVQLAHQDLPADLRGLVCGRGLAEQLAFCSVFHQQSSTLVMRLLEQLLPSAEQSGGVVARALESTHAWLRGRLGPDSSKWRWGRLHAVRYGHVLGAASPVLDRALRLNRGPVPIGGDLDTIAQAGVDPWHPFEAATFCVSYRQVIDVGNWDAMRYILPTGQSGHPGSKHYDDMLDDWRRGAYRTLPFSAGAVEASSSGVIQLTPG